MKVSHRITRLVLIGLAVLALAAPAASARPAPADTPVSTEPFVLDEPAPVISVDEGFDWASAAIGAGGAGALILLVSVGGVTYRHRHAPAGIAR
jgi:hypothetical protein